MTEWPKTTAPVRTPLAPPISRTEQVVTLLGGEIAEGIFKPNDRLPSEHELIARFGVSRTVIREAIAVLKANGLVTTRQGVGAFVAEHPLQRPFQIRAQDLSSVTHVLHVMQLRCAVEVEAAGSAASDRTPATVDAIGRCVDRIDDAIRAGEHAADADFAFHLAIAQASNNPYFAQFAKFLGTVLIPRQHLRLQFRDAEALRTYLMGVQVEHRLLYAAIRDGNVLEARRLMREHLEASRERYRQIASSIA